jgi:hypothetical protein
MAGPDLGCGGRRHRGFEHGNADIDEIAAEQGDRRWAREPGLDGELSSGQGANYHGEEKLEPLPAEGPRHLIEKGRDASQDGLRAGHFETLSFAVTVGLDPGKKARVPRLVVLAQSLREGLHEGRDKGPDVRWIGPLFKLREPIGDGVIYGFKSVLEDRANETRFRTEVILRGRLVSLPRRGLNLAQRNARDTALGDETFADNHHLFASGHWHAVEQYKAPALRRQVP